jgi:hypothetical protein
MGSIFLRRALATAVVGVAASFSPTQTRAQAVVRGVLYDDATGAPLKGTVMLVDPGSDAAVVYTSSDSAGNFILKTRLGAYQIAALHPGYNSILSAPIQLADGEQLTVRIPIAEKGDPTHRIGVLERTRPGMNSESKRRDGEQMSGMRSRQEGRRLTGAGVWYDRERLVKSGFTTLGQFLQTVPGLQVRDPSSTTSMQMSRSAALNSLGLRGPSGTACHLGWFLDGHRIDLPGRNDPLTDGLGSTQLDAVESIEVFRGVSEMPAEFASPDLRCGAVAIWTRRS